MNMKTKEEGEEVTMMDVYEEFNTKIMERYKINQYKSRMVTKNYAFDIFEVPSEGEYLEIQYAVSSFIFLLLISHFTMQIKI